MFDLETQQFPGLFVAVEGIDAAGGSTLVANLTGAMNDRGLRTFATKEPTDNLIGGLIRGALTHEWNPSPRTLQQLFVADRSHHLDRMILPALRKGQHVVTDRYFWSTLAFGWMALDLVELINYNNAYPYPDLTFLLDVGVATTQERLVEARAGLELFEKKSFQEMVRENYLALVGRYPGRITVLDGRLSPEQLTEQALQAVLNHPLIKEGYRILKPTLMPNLDEDKARLRHGWEEKTNNPKG